MGLLDVIKDFFHPSPPTAEVIVKTIHTLKVQCVKLEHVTVRLRERDRLLFETCVSEVKNDCKERAYICANEVAEVRKLLKIVTNCRLALERIVLRLETIKELGDILVYLKPTLKTLGGLVRHLETIMPDIASELERVSNSIAETLVTTRMSDPQPVTPYEASSPASKEILNEVSSFLEDRLMKNLPEPPSPVPVKKTVKTMEKKEMVALAASCPEADVEKKTEPYFSYKDMKMSEVSFEIQRSPLEDEVLKYAKHYNGEINVEQCAAELNISPAEVMKALQSLGSQGKIQIYR